MDFKRVPIESKEYEKIVHVDNSATHWALEHSKAQMEANKALSQYSNLVAAKNQMVTDLVKAVGDVQISRIVQARIVKDAEGATFVELALQEPETEPEPAAPAPEPPAAPAS